MPMCNFCGLTIDEPKVVQEGVSTTKEYIHVRKSLNYECVYCNKTETLKVSIKTYSGAEEDAKPSITLTADELNYMRLFEAKTNIQPEDVIIDLELNRLIFITSHPYTGVAIGKGGNNVAELKKASKKGIEIVEKSDDLVQFIRNALIPIRLEKATVIKKNKKVTVTIFPAEGQKGLAIGSKGRTARKLRLIAKRYFGEGYAVRIE